MPAKRQSIRVPEIRNHYKENTNQKSGSRDRVGGVGCFGLPSTIIYLSHASFATYGGSGIYYLNANTTISSTQTLILTTGQILYLNSINGDQQFSFTNNGTIIIQYLEGNDGQASGGINASNSSFPIINTGTIIINGFIFLLPTGPTGMKNSGTIHVQSLGCIGVVGNFINTGVITNKANDSGIGIGWGGNGTLTNAGIIRNKSGGTISIGDAYSSNNGTLINQNGGTIINKGTITKVPGLSTFTNNGTYKGPPPAS